MRISEASVLNRFATTPTDMTMQTHMGMIMYAPTDQIHTHGDAPVR